MSFETPRSVALELVMYLDNDGNLYRNRTIPAIKRLCELIATGQYERGRPTLLVRLMIAKAAHGYGREFRCDPDTTFPQDIRNLAAQIWLQQFEAEYECNQYGGINPVEPSHRCPLPPKQQAAIE